MRKWLYIVPLLALCAMVTACYRLALAQDGMRFIYPTEGQVVRGEITVRFEGIPEGGYVMLKLDDEFKQATAEGTWLLNTFDKSVFPRNVPTEGQHTLSITGINAAGKRTGTAQVTFTVANTTVEEGAPAVTLTHFRRQDRIGSNVLRYRIFAESNAEIEGTEGQGGGVMVGGGGGGPAGAGGGMGETQGAGWLSAPLDWQLVALVRRMVRDVDMIDNGANIRYVVQTAHQRQRLQGNTSGGGPGMGGGAGGAAGMGGGAAAPGAPGASGQPGAGPQPAGNLGAVTTGAAGNNQDTTARPGCKALRPPRKLKVPVKGPWKADSCGPLWELAPEMGLSFVKMIRTNGEEINATRKASATALADLLPTFPAGQVRPGYSWPSTMTFVPELSTRMPLLVELSLTFTTFDNYTTPAGKRRRIAKLEVQKVPLPTEEAKKVAMRLSKEDGSGGMGREANNMMGDDDEEEEDNIQAARATLSRVLWFDIERRLVLRSEDNVDLYYEKVNKTEGSMEAPGMGGPMGGPMGGGEEAEEREQAPTKVSYNLRITTYLDDRVPPPHEKHTAGAGTAHARDSVKDPAVLR